MITWKDPLRIELVLLAARRLLILSRERFEFEHPQREVFSALRPKLPAASAARRLILKVTFMFDYMKARVVLW